jgi:hypothetical protein
MIYFWLKVVADIASLLTLPVVIGLLFGFTKEWKEGREAAYKALEENYRNQLSAKDLIIRDLEGKTFTSKATHEKTLTDLIQMREQTIETLKKDLVDTNLSVQEKSARIDSINQHLKNRERAILAVSKLNSIYDDQILEAVRELRNLHDPSTIGSLARFVNVSSPSWQSTQVGIEVLQSFGEEAIPALVDEVRDHAKLLREGERPGTDLGGESWQGAVLDSEAGKLLIQTGNACRPYLEKLARDGDLEAQAAQAILKAIDASV